MSVWSMGVMMWVMRRTFRRMLRAAIIGRCGLLWWNSSRQIPLSIT
ncbi:hypothetical protein ACIGFK_38930 [Streptomyces sp. NPDC085524]